MDLPILYSFWFQFSWCCFSTPSLMCLSANFSVVFKRKDDKLIGQYALASVKSYFPGFGVNVTLACLQTIGINPYAMQVLNTWQRYGTKCSAPCCKSAGKILSIPADFKCCNMPSTHLISDWLIDYISDQMTVSPVRCVFAYFQVQLSLPIIWNINHCWVWKVNSE